MRFFLIDRITRWDVGKTAEARKNVALSEDFFDDHFPRRPVMPGVLIIEGMAQLAGLLLEASLRAQFQREAKAILTILDKVKFRDMVKPGDTLIYTTDVLSLNEVSGKAAVRATREGRLIAATEMIFSFRTVDDPTLERRRQVLLDLWRGTPDD
ncbi:MAG: 3-hydroxyacyl-[acyl-carrier-protein] dehydratase, FabZ form [Candidatus Ozemobacter sibiricus]|uniref:3-hydroxyacyl-[acyl-carrier-protein] dehydratase, FabZ form n=1 Tax=Candidatus Ozemobacter sibiricus TaxID=2268124 RepID=A0A367ZSL2_9BACT|nr:MAG: 3-hydroxyacyl-[acyl-carrier-protein] dehydratase, FabZ form [Candidatus Ozemobacter sibiricus]